MQYWLLIATHLVVMGLALVHALIYKRDHRAALGWIGIIIVFPIAGPLLYFVFGINRVRSIARNFSGQHLPFLHFGYERSSREHSANQELELATLPPIMRVGARVTGAPANGGNTVNMLINGEQFFPELIAAIDNARDYILLSSYLFSRKGIATDIINALGRAVGRGARVHVLVDSNGVLYSLRAAIRPLRKVGIELAEFMPLSLFPPSFGINLRNHRKIVVVDGAIGFFGGINIDHRHMVDDPANPHPTQDIHFSARGPVVDELQRIFARDWWMATKRQLENLQSTPASAGPVCCRAIDDGPDENLDALAMTLLGVFAAARKRITIMTPYFLPNREITSALQAASVRGVKVTILLPERSNLRIVDWATRNLLWELVIWNVAVYYKAPPFAHSKLIVVDHHYVMGGSANIDPRSLRLNFELGVEMLDKDLAANVEKYIKEGISKGRRVSLRELDERPLLSRMRDAFFWLFSSYL